MECFVQPYFYYAILFLLYYYKFLLQEKISDLFTKNSLY